MVIYPSFSIGQFPLHRAVRKLPVDDPYITGSLRNDDHNSIVGSSLK